MVSVEIEMVIQKMRKRGELLCPACNQDSLDLFEDGDVDDCGKPIAFGEYFICSNPDCEKTFNFELIPIQDVYREEFRIKLTELEE